MPLTPWSLRERVQGGSFCLLISRAGGTPHLRFSTLQKHDLVNLRAVLVSCPFSPLACSTYGGCCQPSSLPFLEMALHHPWAFLFKYAASLVNSCN